MYTIRKIIADKIANLKDKRTNDYADGFNDGLFEAFKIFLEEIPAPRTEQEILKEFEKLGWYVSKNSNREIIFRRDPEIYSAIWIDKLVKEYLSNAYLSMQEHNLLSELFEVISNDK